MGEAIRQRRAEDDREPVLRKEQAVDHFVAGRRLHPAVGGKDPECRQQACRRPPARRRRNAWPGGTSLRPNSSTPRKRRFQKERHQALIGQQRRNDVAGDVGEAAPVGAELERHDDAGDDAHAERDRKNPQPELREIEEHGAPGQRIGAFKEGDERGQADGEGRQKDVPADDPGELDAGEEFRIEMHVRTPVVAGPTGRLSRRFPTRMPGQSSRGPKRTRQPCGEGERYRYVRRPSL